MKQTLLCVLLLFSSGAINATNPPIAKLKKPSGPVEYSVNRNTVRPALEPNICLKYTRFEWVEMALLN